MTRCVYDCAIMEMCQDDDVVILIDGVSLQQCLEMTEYEYFDSENSEDSDHSENEQSAYETIPDKFMGLDTWITSTDILCYHCCLSHEHPPIFVTRYFKTTNVGVVIYIEKRLFCSFPCAMKYIEETYTGNVLYEKTEHLRYTYQVFTDSEIDYISRAPNREEIDIFGGSNSTYTADKFQRYVYSLIPPSSYLI